MSRILILSMFFVQFAWTGPLTERRLNGWLNGWSGAKSLAGQIAASVQNFKPLDLRLGSLFVPMTSIGSAYYEHIADRQKRIQELRNRGVGSGDSIQALSKRNQKEDTAELLRLINLGNRWEEKEEEEDSFGLEAKELLLEKPTKKVSLENGPKMWMTPPGQAKGPASQPEPFPTNLRLELPDPTIPWAVSDRVFGSMVPVSGAVYKKAEILPTDKEWRFVWRQFYHDKPTKFGIGRIYCVHERTQTDRFENNLATIEKEAVNPDFAPDWRQEPRADQRAIAINRWEAATNGFSPFDVILNNGRRTIRKTIKILPLWHGSNNHTNNSYFGNGIYFTNSARYVADIYNHGHLMMSWVSMREPFPVVGDSNQQDMKILCGKGAYRHYNAHYIPVVPQNQTFDCAEYFPCQPGQVPVCDELVVFQGAQILPRYLVELRVEHPAMISPNVSFCEAQTQLQQAQQTHPRRVEAVARTMAMTVNPTRKNWCAPKGAKQVGALEWELEQKNSERMTFEEAQAYAESKKKAGWRLPTIWELEALYQQHKALGKDLNTGWYFWSETPVADFDGLHWSIHFGNCFVRRNHDFCANQVRLCREQVLDSSLEPQ